MCRTLRSHSMKPPARPYVLIALAAILTAMLGLGMPRVAAGSDIFVTTTQQGVTSGGCSLQEAIYSSEFKASKAIDATDPNHYYKTGCVAGSGNDTIVLPGDAVLTFDHFWDGDAYNIFGPTATPIIFSTITIEGNYSTLEWVGAGNSRLFAVAGPGIKTPSGTTSGIATLILRNVYVKGFHVRGGDGGNGAGGGGLGAGGAIYVNGVLTVVNSTFDGNGAVGGNGGDNNEGNVNGGGGGLSGNGGNSNIGGAGGGGGSRGNGGTGGPDILAGGGGGGGGTVFSGGDGTSIIGKGPSTGIGGPGGYLCGGNGGDAGNNGHTSKCMGGGGGGGGGLSTSICSINCSGSGAAGGFGGGGGGGVSTGGNGGFGGGGGAGGNDGFSNGTGTGGNGGFGGGGGGAAGDPGSSSPGKGGAFGGNAIGQNGGGGGALGGAIFNYKGIVTIQDCTFTRNFVTRGVGAGAGQSGLADNGADAGGAIFSYDNNLEVIDSTFSGNEATGSGGAVVVYSDASGTNFVLNDSIIALNGDNECFTTGGVNVGGAGNLIMTNGTGKGEFSPCAGVVSTSNPGLGKLQNNQGTIPTMAIGESSPAWNTADAGTSLTKDQRGQDRPAMGGFDIGAFELCLEGRPPAQFPCTISAGVEPTEPLTMQVSPPASGNTMPPVGLTNEPAGSVPILIARGNLNNSFASWTGSVTDPTSSTTTIIMQNGQTVTANFVPCQCAGDVTGSVTITFGPILLNKTTGFFTQHVTVKNSSASVITGPISLVLDSLSSTATLNGPTGTTDSEELPAGSPYINSNANLPVGQNRAFALQFTDPSHANITYTARVLAGPGAR
jgi:hypothetical protein